MHKKSLQAGNVYYIIEERTARAIFNDISLIRKESIMKQHISRFILYVLIIFLSTASIFAASQAAEPTPKQLVKQGEASLLGLDFASIEFKLEVPNKHERLATVSLERKDELVFRGEKYAYLSFSVGSGKMNVDYQRKQENMLAVPLNDGKLPVKISLAINSNASYLEEKEKQILLKPQKNDYIAIELRDPQGQLLSITNYFLHD